MVVLDSRHGTTRLLSAAATETLQALIDAGGACTLDDLAHRFGAGAANEGDGAESLSTEERAGLVDVISELIRLGLVNSASA